MLTERLDQGALREVTLNLESWEDQPLIECAEAIWSAQIDSRWRKKGSRSRRAQNGGQGSWPTSDVQGDNRVAGSWPGR